MSAELIRQLQTRLGVSADGVYGPQTHAKAMALFPKTMSRKLGNGVEFFDAIRRPLFPSGLSQPQVDGLNALLMAMGDAGWSIGWTAYGLATAYHETAKTMQPVREAYWKDEAWRETNLRYFPWYGRGYVQLTWEANYRRADNELGLGGALVVNLDLAMDPEIAAQILVKGMQEGWFTGKSLVDYIPGEQGALLSFKEARRIINGTDRAEPIANIALAFQDALRAGKWA